MLRRSLFIGIAIITMLVSTGTVSFAVTPQAIGVSATVSKAEPEISAPSAILVEAETGQVLYSKNAGEKLHISAACKLMTALAAIENSDLYANATVSAEAAGKEGSGLNLEVGSKYLMNDLLYAIMLTSANDAATVVAENVSSGSIDKFVNKMNETALKLNMSNTHFTNPTGLMDEYQYTTAQDISLLIRYATRNTTFNRIFTTKARPWYTPGKEAKILTSSNKLFWAYDGIEGGKTGYNNKEQQTLICTAARTDIKLICVILDAPEGKLYSDAESLLDYGYGNFWKSTLVSKGETLKTVNLEGKEINLLSQSEIKYMHPIGENYIKEFTATADLKQPLKKSMPAGSAKYVLEDGTEINIGLYPESEVVPPDDLRTRINKKIQDNKDIFIIVMILLLIEVILLLFNAGKLVGRLVAMLARRIRQRSN
ncbi:MAG TPA: D-alanyl-D-alanine carboxypeptidase family protein [Clostridia bacterium]|nr:D-alanyl-D-alanine carboxypeptidase family protein [Clostridia bacterium]